MNYNEFMRTVRQRIGLQSEAEVSNVIEATLTTLSERLAGNEAANLAAQLPTELQGFLPGKPNDIATESFGVEEFLERVARKERVDEAEASKHARAVMTTVADAVSGGELTDISSQLPVEYGLLFYTGGDFLAEPQNWEGASPTV